MSRGPGVWQRAILSALESASVVVLTSPHNTPAEQSAIRRAANSLERAGRIEVASVHVEGRPRLVAGRPGGGLAAGRLTTVMGLDGKEYRTATAGGEGMSMRAAAKILGVSPSTISRDHRSLRNKS